MNQTEKEKNSELKLVYILTILFVILLIYPCLVIINTTKKLNSIVPVTFSATLASGDEHKDEVMSIIPPEIETKFSDIDLTLIKNILPHTSSFKTTNPDETYSGEIILTDPTKYNFVEGITTFRGNNYRDSAFYGELEIKENKLTKVWTNVIGQTDSWTGVGWNGQPAIIKWDNETRTHMNLYEEFLSKENFVEVIYGALDSKIHFYDLETGHPTRDPIEVPSSIKGSVTIDPRGYPLLYVGQGINEVSGESVKMGYHIFSLIDGQELLFINGRDSYAYLGWGAFDGNPLIDAKTDTMILPGENGLVYVVKLNTDYNKLSGTISINPIITRLRTATQGKAGGIENSITIFNHYAYFMNNNGIVQCIDLNDLSIVWNYNMGDDCDATIALEEENNKVMLYAGSEVDRQLKDAPAYARKIDGYTGEVVWEYSLNCRYDPNINGGILSTPVVGKDKISNMVIFNFSKVTSFINGKMVALNKNDGTVIWEKNLTYYSWSSPVAVYSKTGDAYIVFCDAHGQVLLIDALTGKTIYTLNTGGGNIEGSPAIYNNKIIIGTRGKRIYCIEIK